MKRNEKRRGFVLAWLLFFFLLSVYYQPGSYVLYRNWAHAGSICICECNIWPKKGDTHSRGSISLYLLGNPTVGSNCAERREFSFLSSLLFAKVQPRRLLFISDSLMCGLSREPLKLFGCDLSAEAAIKGCTAHSRRSLSNLDTSSHVPNVYIQMYSTQ